MSFRVFSEMTVQFLAVFLIAVQLVTYKKNYKICMLLDSCVINQFF